MDDLLIGNGSVLDLTLYSFFCCIFVFCTAQAFDMELLPPYLSNQNSTFMSAVNFAVAGATTLDHAFFASKKFGPLMTPFSLDTQIQWFLSERKKFCATYRERGTSLASYEIFHFIL